MVGVMEEVEAMVEVMVGEDMEGVMEEDMAVAMEEVMEEVSSGRRCIITIF